LSSAASYAKNAKISKKSCKFLFSYSKTTILRLVVADFGRGLNLSMNNLP
jgi:hypothetical protein